MSEICVVHLVWKPLGLTPLRNFVESYRRNDGGIRHRLVVAFNGFAADAELGEYHEVLEGIQYEWFRVYPPTQDIPVYLGAARRFECDYLCFLNSYSVLLDPAWLAKLHQHIKQPEVGLVGATGAWTSLHSWARYMAGKTNSYTGILPKLERWPEPPVLFALSEGLKDKIRKMPPARRAIVSLYYDVVVKPFYVILNYARFLYAEFHQTKWSVILGRWWEDRKRLNTFSAAKFGPFPNPHIRSNAFMIAREHLLNLKTWPIRTKGDAYRFEHGRQGMTNQLKRMGLKVLVVGRNGYAYEEDDWPLSDTFYQGEQTNLLVADNATRHYAEGDAGRRSFLSRGAWGTQAAPSLSERGKFGRQSTCQSS